MEILESGDNPRAMKTKVNKQILHAWKVMKIATSLRPLKELHSISIIN
jgi:hypothetical protein